MISCYIIIYYFSSQIILNRLLKQITAVIILYRPTLQTNYISKHTYSIRDTARRPSTFSCTKMHVVMCRDVTQQVEFGLNKICHKLRISPYITIRQFPNVLKRFCSLCICIPYRQKYCIMAVLGKLLFKSNMSRLQGLL